VSTIEDLVEAVVAQTYEENGRKKLACADAFKLAKKHKVKLGEIGEICNRQNIRICNCQLGCFK